MTHPARPQHGLATRAVHAGRLPLPPDQPVGTPIFASVGFLAPSFDELDQVLGGERPGYVYTRYANPTVAALEGACAALEGAEDAVAFASGMAAIHCAMLALGLGSGGRLVASRDLYGATQALFTDLLSEHGVEVDLVDATDLAAVSAALKRGPARALFVEAISNPLLKLVDLPALADLARGHRVPLVVDATFATPVLLRPLELGATVVVHSATKYLAGHGDVTAGVLAGGAGFCTDVRTLQKLTGAILGPQEAWAVARGIKTLPLRLRRQSENALGLARWLAGHPKVASVIYPGLPSHPQHDLASRFFPHGYYGGMLAFVLRDESREAVARLFESLQLCLTATTLGDVYTQLLYPAIASHRNLSPRQRQALGISDGLVRVSAGIEDLADLVADLDQALARV